MIRNAPRKQRGSLASCLTSLALDLIAGPTCCVSRSLGEFAVGPDILGHLRDPVLPEQFNKLAFRKGVREITIHGQPPITSIGDRIPADIPNDTHTGPEQTLAPIRVCMYGIQKGEDGLHERGKLLC